MTRPSLALVSRTPDVRVVDHDTRFELVFERWYRRTAGGGSWRFLPQPRRWRAFLEAPRLADWTPATVDDVIAVARAELAARGARGRLEIAATADESALTTSSVEIRVRVGDHRATLTLDAGTVRYPLPTPILATVAERVSRPTVALTAAVRRRGREPAGS